MGLFHNIIKKKNSFATHFKSSSSSRLQGKNYDSNARLVVDEDDNGQFRLERFNSDVF